MHSVQELFFKRMKQREVSCLKKNSHAIEKSSQNLKLNVNKRYLLYHLTAKTGVDFQVNNVVSFIILH